MTIKKIITLLVISFIAVSMFTGCEKTEKVTGFRVLEENFGAEEYGIGFRKDDIALGLEIQKYLEEMHEDGTFAQISQKWFGKDTYLADAKFIKEAEAPEGDKSLQNVLDAKKLIVGLDDSFPPMGFRDENQVIVGFDIDLAKEVAKRMKIEIEFKPINWDSKEMELNGGKIDCIWNGMTINEERIKSMFFAKAYIANSQIVIVPENSDIQTKADLEGLVIGLQKGSSALGAVNKDDISSKLKKITQYENNVDAFTDLKIGRIKALVVDEVVGRYLIEKDSGK